MARTRSSTGAASVAQKRKVSHVEVDDGHEAPSVTPTVASKRRKATSKKTKSQHSPSPIGAVTEEEVTSPVVEAEVKHASVEAAEAGSQQHEKTTTKSKAVKTGKAREKATTKTNVTSKASADAASHADGEAVPDGPRFWLMKAEPNTRIENGVDVKFGIDDLEAATEPEPWEGVRNYVARNNMMAMKKGELAFFYHSNCKVPGIAGIMEVVKESCVDESAFDAKHPYHDPKSSKDRPRWFMVHVGFKRKFKDLVTLKQLQALGGSETPLQNMQVLKQSRLSVSKVSAEEWAFIMEMVESRELDKSNDS